MKVYRSINSPIRDIKDMKTRWHSSDKGLIHCWELGRRLALKNPELAERAKSGELIPLGWKGGIKPTINTEGNEIAPQYKYKLGSYNYLAEYLGLRGEDLNIDTDYSNNLKCSRFGIIVEFTDDISLLSSEVQVGAKSLTQQ